MRSASSEEVCFEPADGNEVVAPLQETLEGAWDAMDDSVEEATVQKHLMDSPDSLQVHTTSPTFPPTLVDAISLTAIQTSLQHITSTLHDAARSIHHPMSTSTHKGIDHGISERCRGEVGLSKLRRCSITHCCHVFHA